MGYIRTKGPTNKPTDIIVEGEDLWKHLLYTQVLSPEMVEKVVDSLVNKFPTVETIQVRNYGKLTELFRIKL